MPDGRMHTQTVFQIRDTEVLPEAVRRGDMMITMDIAKAYYAVPIADEIGPYLAVEFDGKWYIQSVTIWALAGTVRVQ